MKQRIVIDITSNWGYVTAVAIILLPIFCAYLLGFIHGIGRHKKAAKQFEFE